MFRAHAGAPVELSCQYIGDEVAIAADNEGDIFVNGYQNSFHIVTEIPTGPNGPQPNNCAELPQLRSNGYPAGLAVDPKTDDLVVLSDPDECAGGVEGLLTIYPSPYGQEKPRKVNLKGNCVGRMRLDANSTTVFALDNPFAMARHSHGRERRDDRGEPIIIQRSYPDGRNMGEYHGGVISGFTTIPNTLPN